MNPRLSVSLSIAALVVAVLGSTPLGEAARQLVVPRNSVGTPQLRIGAVTGAKIANRTITGADVRLRTLRSAHFAAGTLLRGATGPQGPAGAAGPQGTAGPQGPSGIVKAHRVFQLGNLDSTSLKSVQVMCPAGEIALGGGFNIGKVEPTPPVAVLLSLPVLDGEKPVGWRVEAVEVAAYANSWRPVVSVVCAPTT
jgi:hypothetical protein